MMTYILAIVVLKAFAAPYPDLSLQQRIEASSAQFLEAPYLNDPLGEGESGEFDQDPLYRFDAFDCTTFVETVMALSLSGSMQDFQSWMNRIRYQNALPKFEYRNHFPSLDWVPHNASQGILQDITLQLIDSTQARTSKTQINKQNWFKKLGLRRIQLVSEALSDQLMQEALLRLNGKSALFGTQWSEVAYIPLIHALDAVTQEKIPSGSIVNFISPNWDLGADVGTLMDVSHQGLLIQKKGRLYLRHASSHARKVQDVPLTDYLQKFQRPSQKVPVKGIQVLQLLKVARE